MPWGRRVSPLSLVAATILALATLPLGACARSGNVVESRPLSSSLDKYRTGAVELDPKVVEQPEKEGPAFVAYLETRLRSTGALEPASLEQGAELLLRVRPGTGTDDDTHLVVDLLDTKTRATIGQVEITASAMGGKTDASLRRAADEIAAYIRANRKTPVPPRKNADVPVPPAVVSDTAPARATAGVVKSGECATTCRSDSTSSVSVEDLQRIAESLHPSLTKIRGCLDRVSAQAIQPAMILRFESAGQLVSLRVDAGGYDELACILDARGGIPQVRTSRAASMRCDHQCR